MKRMRLRGERGAATVEFAIIAVVLLMIVFGIIEFGILMFDKHILTNASREGARAGIVMRITRLPDKDIPLFLAVASGDIDALEEALTHCDKNARDKDGMTVLHHAAGNLQDDIVDRLLEEINNGLDPFIKDRFGREASWMPIEVHGEEGAYLANKIADAIYHVSEEDLELNNNDDSIDPYNPGF